MTTAVRGIEATITALKKAASEVEGAAPKAAAAGGKVVGLAMAARAPKRTGKSAASISTDVQSFGSKARSQTGAEVDYDRFVQKGTRFMDAQAYGEESVDAVATAVVEVIAAIYVAALR